MDVQCEARVVVDLLAGFPPPAPAHTEEFRLALKSDWKLQSLHYGRTLPRRYRSKVVYDDMTGTKQHLKSVWGGVGERHAFSGKIY